jgi:hypothetical protein
VHHSSSLFHARTDGSVDIACCRNDRVAQRYRNYPNINRRLEQWDRQIVLGFHSAVPRQHGWGVVEIQPTGACQSFHASIQLQQAKIIRNRLGKIESANPLPPYGLQWREFCQLQCRTGQEVGWGLYRDTYRLSQSKVRFTGNPGQVIVYISKSCLSACHRLSGANSRLGTFPVSVFHTFAEHQPIPGLLASLTSLL